MISITLGEPGLSLVTTSERLLLVPQTLEAATVNDPVVKVLLKVTSMIVSLMPAPPGCPVMVALAGAVQL